MKYTTSFYFFEQEFFLQARIRKNEERLGNGGKDKCKVFYCVGL